MGVMGFTCAVYRRFHFDPDDNLDDPDYIKGDNKDIQSFMRDFPMKRLFETWRKNGSCRTLMTSAPLRKSQKYKLESSTEWPVLKASYLNNFSVFCTLCRADFSVSHGGRNDCQRQFCNI